MSLKTIRSLLVGLTVSSALFTVGCRTCGTVPAPRMPVFAFAEDTLAYPNELAWSYQTDPDTGKTKVTNRDPAPDYSLHCFVVARTARQFLYHARFAPDRPRLNEQEYRRRIRAVLQRSETCVSPSKERVVFPGYANLRSFSHDWEATLKEAGGGAWHSYAQRGNWRLVFPFRRGQQARLSERLARELTSGRVPIVHVVRFPQLTINHALLVFECAIGRHQITFHVYDPNVPEHPGVLVFDRATRTFYLPPNIYFAGGPVDVYEVYRNCLY